MIPTFTIRDLWRWALSVGVSFSVLLFLLPLYDDPVAKTAMGMMVVVAVPLGVTYVTERVSAPNERVVRVYRASVVLLLLSFGLRTMLPILDPLSSQMLNVALLVIAVLGGYAFVEFRRPPTAE